MRYKNMFLASCLMAATIAVPAAFAVDTNSPTPEPAKVGEVADHLSVFEQQAAKVSRDAATLRSLSQDHRTAWESHTYYLNHLRNDVNGMGKMLAELEQMKPEASEVQQMAVERARPHLVAVASATTEALNQACEGIWKLRQPQYKETVANLAKQAEILHQTVDTIVGSHNANERLDRLEASHEDWEI